MALAALWCALIATPALTYPERPVTVMVTTTPGGAPDIVARVLAEKLTPSLGQPVVVENRPGSNGNTAGEWIRLLSVPYRLMFPVILLLCSIGVYSLNNSAVEVGLTALFGIIGYLFLKLGCEPAPFVLGLILGPMTGENLRRALLLSRGDPAVFVERPISLTLLVLAAALLILFTLPSFRRTREVAFEET